MDKYHSALTLIFLWFVGGNAVVAVHAPAIPASAATHAFSEAHKLCTMDNGELWDHSLCGPMMFVDQASGTAILNAPVPGAIRDGALWRITLPESVPLASTAVEYSGQRWTMALWLLPEDKTERDILLMHESFHRVQPALGLPAGGRTVTFPLVNTSTSFDPRQITQFADHGSVYNVIHINDVWDELSVKTGALVSPGFDYIILPIKQELTGDHLSGGGWSATLKGTFGLAPDPHKPGSWVVVKKETPIQ